MCYLLCSFLVVGQDVARASGLKRRATWVTRVSAPKNKLNFRSDPPPVVQTH